VQLLSASAAEVIEHLRIPLRREILSSKLVPRGKRTVHEAARYFVAPADQENFLTPCYDPSPAN